MKVICGQCEDKCELCGETWGDGGSSIWVPILGLGIPAFVVTIGFLAIKFL